MNDTKQAKTRNSINDGYWFERFKKMDRKYDAHDLETELEALSQRSFSTAADGNRDIRMPQDPDEIQREMKSLREKIADEFITESNALPSFMKSKFLEQLNAIDLSGKTAKRELLDLRQQTMDETGNPSKWLSYHEASRYSTLYDELAFLRSYLLILAYLCEDYQYSQSAAGKQDQAVPSKPELEDILEDATLSTQEKADKIRELFR